MSEEQKKNETNMYREKKYYVIIFVVLIAYWIASFFLPLDEFTKRITTTTTLIAAVVLWLQMKRAERLNESNFIMNLNNQFVGNKDMTLVEHELEQCYNQFESMADKDGNISDESLKKLRLGLNQSRNSEDCQKLINYLVYLEALSALIYRKVLHLEVIDNLFSYRFFIAVNNPIVQQDELFPYADYYQGIFELSKIWTKQKTDQKIAIPMYQFDLITRYNEYKKYENDKYNTKKITIPLDVSTACSSDKKNEIAKCIYGADSIIYPEAFGEDPEQAAKAISRIIGMDYSLFDYKNLLVARYNGQVCGVCVINDGNAKWDRNAIKERIGEKYLSKNLQEAFDYTSEHYFEEECVKGPGENAVELVAFCVDEGFRRKHIGSAMLTAMKEQYKGKKIILTVLAENATAIRMYEKNGFVKVGDTFKGYSPKGLQRPDCFKMEMDL